MGMLTTFWLKQYLKQGRLVVVYALVLVLAVINAFIYSDRFAQDTAEYERLQRAYGERYEEAAGSPDKMSGARFFFALPARNLKFMADSKIETVPTVAQVSPERIFMPSVNAGTGQNFLGFDAIDLAFIVEVILSFIAIVLTYDAVCGERQQGTLKQMMANGVPRRRIFASKIAAAVITLALPLLLGLLLNLATMQALGKIPKLENHYAAYGLFFLFSLLLILFFSSLGVTVSALTRSPVTSLVVGVLLWSLLVVIAPGGGKLIGKVLSPVRSPEEYQRLNTDINTKYLYLGIEAGAMTRPPSMAMSDNFKGERIYNRFAEQEIGEKENLAREQLKGLYSQAEAVNLLSVLSPSSVYRQAVARLSDNDLTTLQDFFDQSDKYSNALFSAMRLADENDSDSAHLLYMANAGAGGYLSTKPFGTAPPRFEWREQDVLGRAAGAAASLLILAAMTAVVILLGAFAFNRYDVR
jgi:ABC-2 type transport system permease protein